VVSENVADAKRAGGASRLPFATLLGSTELTDGLRGSTESGLRDGRACRRRRPGMVEAHLVTRDLLNEQAFQMSILISLGTDQVVRHPILTGDAGSSLSLGLLLDPGGSFGVHLCQPRLLERLQIFDRKPPRLLALLKLPDHPGKRLATVISQRTRPFDLPPGIDQRGEHLGGAVERVAEVRAKVAG
jgi:hypothetical protein